MSHHRKIDVRIWNDQKFLSLSERGKLAFLMLLTHPMMTALGAMRGTCVAVTPGQVALWNLPTRPAKSDGNSHAARFEGDSVEVDPMPPAILKDLLRSAIEAHMISEQLNVLQQAELSERNMLLDWARHAASPRSSAG